jgi:hypothetical protein
MLGQFVEGDLHRSDPAPSLAKYVVGWTASERAGFQCRIAPLRLFGPDACVLLW